MWLCLSLRALPTRNRLRFLICFGSLRARIRIFLRTITGGLIYDRFAFYRPKLCTVGLQNLNQIALLLDHAALFHDQHGHKRVGGEEDDRK